MWQSNGSGLHSVVKSGQADNVRCSDTCKQGGPAWPSVDSQQCAIPFGYCHSVICRPADAPDAVINLEGTLPQ
jgi:hypothetical protein